MKNEVQSYFGKTVWWHGSCSGDLRGGRTGLHLGTYQAAKQALEARIGIPADGKGWTGNRRYGATLLAGWATLQSKMNPDGSRYVRTGFNCDVPMNDFYIVDCDKNDPSNIWETLKYPNGEYVSLDCKPDIQPFLISGKMTNSASNPHEDFKANGYMGHQLKRGLAKSGYYYKNASEDEGSISIVVPNGDFITLIEFPKP